MLRQMISVSLLIVVVLLVRTVFRNQVPNGCSMPCGSLSWSSCFYQGRYSRCRSYRPSPRLRRRRRRRQPRRKRLQRSSRRRHSRRHSSRRRHSRTPQQPLAAACGSGQSECRRVEPHAGFSDCLGRRQRRTDCLDGTDLGQLQSAAAADAPEVGPMGQGQYLCFDRSESAVPGGISPGGLPDGGRRPSKEIELIVQHELTHLRHLDFLCRPAGPWRSSPIGGTRWFGSLPSVPSGMRNWLAMRLSRQSWIPRRGWCMPGRSWHSYRVKTLA